MLCASNIIILQPGKDIVISGVVKVEIKWARSQANLLEEQQRLLQYVL